MPQYFYENEMLEAVGMLDAGMAQVNLAVDLGTRGSAISRIWPHYCVTGIVRKRHLERPKITAPRIDQFIQLKAQKSELHQNLW